MWFCSGDGRCSLYGISDEAAGIILLATSLCSAVVSDSPHDCINIGVVVVIVERKTKDVTTRTSKDPAGFKVAV